MFGCVLGVLLLFILWVLFTISPVLGVIAIIGLIVFYNITNAKEKKEREEIESRKYAQRRKVENELKDYNISQRFISFDETLTIMVDESAKKLCFATVSETNGSTEVYDYNDILESEIIEDGKTITKTSRSGQIGGALIGGVLAGGIGAIIGGLSANQTSENEVVRVDLKIIVNNTKTPVKFINFITGDLGDFNGKPIPFSKNERKYKDAIQKATHWHSLISVLIRQADKEEKKENNSKSVTTDLSVADEIRKLLELKSDGVLTEEEFIIQKQRILSN